MLHMVSFEQYNGKIYDKRRVYNNQFIHGKKKKPATDVHPKTQNLTINHNYITFSSVFLNYWLTAADVTEDLEKRRSASLNFLFRLSALLFVVLENRLMVGWGLIGGWCETWNEWKHMIKMSQIKLLIVKCYKVELQYLETLISRISSIFQSELDVQTTVSLCILTSIIYIYTCISNPLISLQLFSSNSIKYEIMNFDCI